MAYTIQLENVTPYNGEKGPSVSSKHTGSEHTKLDINGGFFTIGKEKSSLLS